MRRLAVGLTAFATLAVLAGPASGRLTYTSSKVRAVNSGVSVIDQSRLDLTSGRSATWSVIASMSQAVRATGGGALASGRVYVPGGYVDSSNVFGQMQIYRAQTSDTWVVDGDELSDLTGLPGVADAAVCADTDGNIHVVNGTLDGVFLYASHLVFTPTAPAGSKWSALALPNTPADGNFYSQDSGCAFINGKMYLWSGYGVTDADPAAIIRKLTWVYDPASDTWTDTGKKMITGRLWHAYTSSATRAFAAGGTNDLASLQSVASTETFTVGGGWKAMADLPTSVLGPGMGFLGSTLTVFGGGSGNAGTGYTLQTSTVGCTGAACGPGPWTDLNKNLNTARWFFAYASGGNALYAAGGTDEDANISLASAEATA